MLFFLYTIKIHKTIEKKIALRQKGVKINFIRFRLKINFQS